MLAPSKSVWINSGCLLLIIGFFLMLRRANSRALKYPSMKPAADRPGDGRKTSWYSVHWTVGEASETGRSRPVRHSSYQSSQDNNRVMPNVSGNDGSNTWREAVLYTCAKEVCNGFR